MKNYHLVRIPPAAASLYAEQSVLAKLRVLWRRIFLSKRQIADQYNVSETSWLVYAFYAVRFKDLAKHHWQTVFDLHRGDRALIAHIAEKEALQKFVAAE